MRRPSSTGWSCPTHPPAWGWGSKAHPAGRGAGALRAVARGAGRVGRPAPPDRRPAPDRRGAGRADPHLAVRPDGHRLPPRHRAGSPPRSPRSPSTTGSSVEICPPRRGNRKGVVEKANHTSRNAGGAPWPTTWAWPKPRPGWTSSASGSATPGAGRWTRPAPPLENWQ